MAHAVVQRNVQGAERRPAGIVQAGVQIAAGGQREDRAAGDHAIEVQDGPLHVFLHFEVAAGVHGLQGIQAGNPRTEAQHGGTRGRGRREHRHVFAGRTAVRLEHGLSLPGQAIPAPEEGPQGNEPRHPQPCRGDGLLHPELVAQGRDLIGPVAWQAQPFAQAGGLEAFALGQGDDPVEHGRRMGRHPGAGLFTGPGHAGARDPAAAQAFRQGAQRFCGAEVGHVVPGVIDSTVVLHVGIGDGMEDENVHGTAISTAMARGRRYAGQGRKDITDARAALGSLGARKHDANALPMRCAQPRQHPPGIAPHLAGAAVNRSQLAYLPVPARHASTART